MQEKTIGILGGMGPYATVEFYRTLLNLDPVKNDYDYPRIIIDSNVKIPSRTRAVLHNEETPVDSVIISINNLAKIGANFVALPCNSVHYWYNEINPQIKIPWLNMLELVSNRIKEKGFKSPLVVGGYVTIEKKIYSNYILNAQYLDNIGNEIIQKVITEIKNTGKLGTHLREHLREQVVRKRREIDSVLFACTELTSNIVGNFNIPAINSDYVYAQEVLKFAKGGQ